MRRIALLFGLLLVAVVPVLPASAQTPSGTVSIRLSDPPDAAKTDPRARVYIVDALRQGDTITRHVEIGNGTDAPINIQLYAAAASIKDGQFTFAEGRTANELTAWTTITPATLLVPAKGTAPARVDVTVPKNAPDGERYAVIWAEQPPSGGGNVPIVNRVGVRMYVSVGTGAAPVTDFTIAELKPSRDKDGNPVVSTTVKNTGGRAIDLSGQLQLDDGPGSLKAGPFPVQLGTTLAPNDSAPATVKLDKGLPNGPWKATVTIRSGEVERKAEAKITFPSDAGAAGDAVKAKKVDDGRNLLVTVAAVLVVAALGGVGFYALRLLRKKPG